MFYNIFTTMLASLGLTLVFTPRIRKNIPRPLVQF